jgi:hypothetical protein
MAKKIGKLQVNRETVRELTQEQLKDVQGARIETLQCTWITLGWCQPSNLVC